MNANIFLVLPVQRDIETIRVIAEMVKAVQSLATSEPRVTRFVYIGGR